MIERRAFRPGRGTSLTYVFKAIYNSNKMDWYDASDACALINASLATIENQEEHEFLISSF